MDVISLIDDIKKPTIAAVHGTPLGGGLELTMGCHFRIAAAGTRLGLPEIKLGLIPGAGGTQRLARALGPARALEMMLEGRTLTPGEALEAGLVHHVVDPARLMERAAETAARLARRSPVAVAALKRAVYEGA